MLASLHLQFITRLAKADDEKIARLPPAGIKTNGRNGLAPFGSQQGRSCEARAWRWR